VQVTADGEEHTIVMTPALTLVGRVTVAGTGEPIEDFKVVPGYGEGSGEQVWERLDSRRGNKGEFKMVFSESNQPWRMRVEAGGYEQAIAGPIPTDFQGVYEIALKKADANAAFRGVVLLPDGEPAAGAGVALLTLDYGVQLMPGGFRNQGVGILTNADAAGSFAFAVDPRAHSVVAVSAAGFVKLRVKNTAKPLTLKLQPWGRIEGTLAERERHQPIDALDLMDDAAMNYPGSVTLDFNAFQAKPDAEGHFAFDRVPPGHFSLYLNRAMGTPLTCRTLVEVRPGESTAVTIGGEGRTVIGKLLAVGVRPEEWRKPDTMATLAPKSDPLPYPEILNAAEAGFWSVDFWQSQAGLDHLNRNRGYGLGLASNGTFRSEGVQPGKYQLWAQVGKLWVDKEVTVPEIPAAGDGEVDLGSFNLVKRSEPEEANEK
jgi:hypothetical protein